MTNHHDLLSRYGDGGSLVIHNARIFTADARTLFVECLAVRNGRVAASGRFGELDPTLRRGVEVIDAGGALVTPGFIDAHVHTATSGLEQLRLNFDTCHNSDEAQAAIAAYAKANPDEPWILGGGWSQAWFERGCPEAALLDGIVPDRPALIANTDGHGAWANTVALRLAGIDSSTPDPPDGRIERLADGSPQGTLHEGARHLVQRLAPKDTVQDFVAGLLRGQQELLSYGVTGWQEAAVTDEVQAAYIRVSSDGQLIGDSVGALWWDRHRGLEQVEELIERRGDAAQRFRPTSVKLMLDGVAENFTASVLDSYLDSDGLRTDNLGVDFIDPGELCEIVTRLDAVGFQCHFHSLGDRAVRSALDALEFARRRNGPSSNRHHLAHLQFVHPDDIPRFAELNAIANAQPLWACNDDYQIELTRPFISPERYSWQYPFASLLHSGARLGMGSDWNVSTANVMEEIAVALSRTGPEGGEPLGADEALTPTEALTAFTLGSAYINHSDADRGSLHVGKAADIVIFERDPFDDDFAGTKVAMTFVDGNLVYER